MQGVAKKIIVGLAASALMMVGLTYAAGADQSPVVGNWSIHDHGQGCWGGGNLRADFTADGGGNCSFSGPDGQTIADLDPASWSVTDSNGNADPSGGYVQLCANITVKKGDGFGAPVGTTFPGCIIVPINTDGPVISQVVGGGTTFGKVTIKN